MMSGKDTPVVKADSCPIQDRELTLTQGMSQTLRYNKTVPYQGAIRLRVQIPGFSGGVSSVLNVSVVTEGFLLRTNADIPPNVASYSFIRISEDPCMLGVNCTVLAPYITATICYKFYKSGLSFHLDDINPRHTSGFTADYPRLMRIFLYPSSTGACKLTVWIENTEPPSLIQNFTLLPGELLEFELEEKCGHYYEFRLNLNKSGTDVYGARAGLVTGPPDIPPRFIEFSGISLVLAGLLICLVRFFQKSTKHPKS
ncbi:MAG: hypothetical protein ACFFBD_06975 [Candidatus Hodarchaeota archaeon]